MNIAVKDYSFMREDRLIGLNVIKLSQVCEQGSWSSWVPLGSRINFDDTGLTILRILSHRTNDELAKEFVALKSARRHKEEVWTLFSRTCFGLFFQKRIGHLFTDNPDVCSVGETSQSVQRFGIAVPLCSRCSSLFSCLFGLVFISLILINFLLNESKCFCCFLFSSTPPNDCFRLIDVINKRSKIFDGSNATSSLIFHLHSTKQNGDRTRPISFFKIIDLFAKRTFFFALVRSFVRWSMHSISTKVIAQPSSSLLCKSRFMWRVPPSKFAQLPSSSPADHELMQRQELAIFIYDLGLDLNV